MQSIPRGLRDSEKLDFMKMLLESREVGLQLSDKNEEWVRFRSGMDQNRLSYDANSLTAFVTGLFRKQFGWRIGVFPKVEMHWTYLRRRGGSQWLGTRAWERAILDRIACVEWLSADACIRKSHRWLCGVIASNSPLDDFEKETRLSQFVNAMTDELGSKNQIYLTFQVLYPQMTPETPVESIQQVLRAHVVLRAVQAIDACRRIEQVGKLSARYFAGEVVTPLQVLSRIGREDEKYQLMYILRALDWLFLGEQALELTEFFEDGTLDFQNLRSFAI